MLRHMIRARKASKGLVTPPPLHRWMEAVLLLCASLVQGAVSTLGMIRTCFSHDWHVSEASVVLPQATNGIYLKEQSSNAQRRNRTLPQHANPHILRDDRRSAPIPQDE